MNRPFKTRFRRIAGIAAICLAFGAAAAADEGMWMPQQMPELSGMLKSRGFKLPASQLSDLTAYPLGAIVQLASGCTGAFISDTGLILTNHHCVQAALQYNSTPERDLLTNGYLANDRSEELWNGPMARAYVTTSMTEVTERILGNIPKSSTDRQRYDIINQREKKIVAECEKGGGVRCYVSPFFGGVNYWLLAQSEIRDVRLVYAPPKSIGYFGGDTDNWMWPRHTGDFAIFRAYAGPDGSVADHAPANVSMEPAQHIRISTAGIAPGDPTMTVGYPGKTARYRTAAELARALDIDYPRNLRYVRGVIAQLKDADTEGEEIRLKNAPMFFGYSNSLKYTEGLLASPTLPEIRRAREAEEKAVGKNAQVSDALDRIAAINARVWKTDERDSAYYWLVRGSRLLNQGMIIYRYALERPKKDADRQWGYQDRDVPRLREAIDRMQATYNPETERRLLDFYLHQAAVLPSGQRIEAIDRALAATGEESVDEQISTLVDTLVEGTSLDDLETRRAMFRSPVESLRKRKDPMLVLVASLIPLSLELEKREEEVFAAMSAARPLYMERLMAAKSGPFYSDANNTPRYSFGTVDGYAPRNGVRFSAFTTAEGIAEKMAKGGPYAPHERLLQRIEARDFGPYADPRMKTLPVNFVTTDDIAGGSSGSPVLNRRGEMVGMVFDGNYEAFGSEFGYVPQMTRSINLDTRYLLWVLDAIGGADELLREIGVEPRFTTK